jgi:chemotaxis protein histidine kinase CheA
MDEEEEKEMIIRISDMTCSYPHELEAAFDEIKNGEETVSKANLIEMFEKLELERKYIELIISELSLCSDDLEHLNFHGFFERFYIDDDPNTDHNDAIEEQGEESEEESYRDASRKKKSTKNIKKNTEEDEDYSPNRYM